MIGLDLVCELVKPSDVPYPAPLDEALPFSVWEEYIKSPPPSPTPEEKAELARQEAELNEKAKRIEQAEREEMSARENQLLSKLSKEEIEQVVSLVTKETFKSLGVSNHKSLTSINVLVSI